jgi:hypothetical protein
MSFGLLCLWSVGNCVRNEVLKFTVDCEYLIVWGCPCGSVVVSFAGMRKSLRRLTLRLVHRVVVDSAYWLFTLISVRNIMESSASRVCVVIQVLMILRNSCMKWTLMFRVLLHADLFLLLSLSIPGDGAGWGSRGRGGEWWNSRLWGAGSRCSGRWRWSSERQTSENYKIYDEVRTSESAWYSRSSNQVWICTLMHALGMSLPRLTSVWKYWIMVLSHTWRWVPSRVYVKDCSWNNLVENVVGTIYF